MAATMRNDDLAKSFALIVSLIQRSPLKETTLRQSVENGNYFRWESARKPEAEQRAVNET